MEGKDPSVARLEDKIDSLVGLVNERLRNLDNKVDAGTRSTSQTVRALSDVVEQQQRRIEEVYVRRDVYDLAHRSLEDRVKEADDRHTWLARTAVTALVLPIIVSIVAAIILTGGIR